MRYTPRCHAQSRVPGQGKVEAAVPMDDHKNVKHQLERSREAEVSCAGLHAVKGLKAGCSQKRFSLSVGVDPDSRRQHPWATGETRSEEAQVRRSDSRSYLCPPPACLFQESWWGKGAQPWVGVRYGVESGLLPAPVMRLVVARGSTGRQLQGQDGSWA